MSQLDELEAIFGRKQEQTAEPGAEARPEQLQIFVTTSHRPTFRLISISKEHAGKVLPLLVNQFLTAVHEYIS